MFHTHIRDHDPSESKFSRLMIWPGRILFLLGTGSLGWFLGIVLVFFVPNRDPQQPWLFKLLSQSNFPFLSSKPLSNNTQSDLNKITPTEKQELESQLQLLQSEVKIIRDRLSTLELQLGTVQSNSSIEDRLQSLEKKLKIAGSSSKFKAQSQALVFTLPSDLLFTDNNNVFRNQAESILDSVVNDLANYPQARIIVSAYMDNVGTNVENRELSFKRAQAVQQYLSANFQDAKYQWLVIGYGENYPIVNNNTDGNRERNRRIEIMILVNGK
jgi:outer membrane protein OmpA-like peptidoglycan-associated protein